MEFTADTSGERLDAFLARSNDSYSRSFWQKICSLNLVKVNDEIASASYKLSVGDKVNAHLPKNQTKPIDIPIIYQDDDVLVLNKPSGILTHAKGAISDEFTLADFVRPLTTDGIDTNRPGIVHRLDRDTSGVIIVAKNPEAKVWLQKQFSLRKAKKTYMALVKGTPKHPSALIDLPIERNPKKPQTFRVAPSGKLAETFYQTEKQFKNLSLLKLQPKTGRTHQLRVHLNYLGCPIVGDPLYGKPNAKLGRMFLHAYQLELTLPSRERKTFTAELPADLTNYLKTLPNG